MFNQNKFQIKRILTLLLCFYSVSLSAQEGSELTFIERNNDDRFIAKHTVGEYRTTERSKDQTAFLKSYTLGVEWWTMMGEPLENYSVKWNGRDYFNVKIDGVVTRVEKKKISKYPDLLKRWENLIPSKLDIKISGKLHENSIANMSAGIGKTGRKGIDLNGNGDFHTQVYWEYELKDWDLLYGKANESHNLPVPSSPQTWNEFFQIQEAFGDLPYNVSEEERRKMQPTVLNEHIKKFKALWKKTNTIELTSKITRIEWPEYEMENIYKLYLQYEKEEKEPSPDEELEEEITKLKKEPVYAKKDFWGEPAETIPLETEVFSESNQVGVRDKKSKKIIIPTGKYSTIKAIDGSNLFEVLPKEYNDFELSYQLANLKRIIDINEKVIFENIHSVSYSNKTGGKYEINYIESNYSHYDRGREGYNRYSTNEILLKYEKYVFMVTEVTEITKIESEYTYKANTREKIYFNYFNVVRKSTIYDLNLNVVDEFTSSFGVKEHPGSLKINISEYTKYIK